VPRRGGLHSTCQFTLTERFGATCHSTSRGTPWENSNLGNQPYESFEEYLSCFRSKRRITIKCERRKVLEDEDIRIGAVVGSDIPKYDGLVERMFDIIYLSTVDKMIWGRQYLTLDFFQLLMKKDFVHNLAFSCARPQSSGPELRAEDVFAGTFNIVKNGAFYGRYWGCLLSVLFELSQECVPPEVIRKPLLPMCFRSVHKLLGFDDIVFIFYAFVAFGHFDIIQYLPSLRK
jgi:predicted N-acyltransferase